MDLRDQLQQTLGASFAIERELGGGGMSRVFLAEERRLHRRVVIKLLSPELAAGVSAERFEREIQLAASLQQANIVPILAAGESKGLPYYTMPFVEGESLRARLAKDGRLSVTMVVGVLRDAAKALAYAHQRGVVHRDIKPDNVLLSGGTAVVTDFGIAKAISAAREAAPGATLTQLGTSIGTPAYMSPEQAAGDPNVDHRADIYSLGCMAHELLAGEAPFAGRTPARTLAAHMTEAPRPLAEVRPDAPAALTELVARCLQKEPSNRPQSAADLVQALDAITSGGMASVPDVLRSAPVPFGRTLGLYATACFVVAVVARAAVIALGVPDWFFAGAMVVMALGLPVMAFTWYVNRTARRLAASSGPQPGAPQNTLQTLAMKASPHVTWRRAWAGGGYALGAFVLGVGAFMGMRELGIGPAASLRGAGRIGERERVIVTEFRSTDSTLVTLVTEAVRTTLGQSRALSIMPPTAIAAALQRMQRPVASRLDLALARDIAQREGVRVIVDGSLQSVAGGFIVSLRLVSADSASTMVAYQATADGPRELLETIDALTRKLRGKVGESLKDVRASAPLERVTTPSLEALRIYAEAAQMIDRGGSPVEGAARLREAVKLDTTFAMAYRKLGVALSNAGLPRAGVDSALERAYRYRARLTERERLLAEGTYFGNGPGRDRRAAARAYEALLAIDPAEGGAANNLANIYSGRREFARAESLFKRSIAQGRATSQQYTNLVNVLFNGGKVEEAERVFDEYRERFPAAIATATMPPSFLYHRGLYDSAAALDQALTRSDNPIIKLNGLGGLANSAMLHGRLEDARRFGMEARRVAVGLGQPPQPPVLDSINLSFVELSLIGDTVSATRRIDRLVARGDHAKLPLPQRPTGALVAFYANVGRPARAREMLALWDAEVMDSTMRRQRAPARHALMAVILMAEKSYPESIGEVWKADSTYDGPDGSCTICLLDDVAYTWDAAGAADSAIFYFERYLNTPYLGRGGLDAVPRAMIVKRLGELYDVKGDAVNAAKRYREFIALWERADPRLQPKVADARRRLSRLADVEPKR